MIKYIINNKEYDPIPMGYSDFDSCCEENSTCHDCGCEFGEIHNEHCDAQRCPKCGGQFITCDCHTFIYDTETKKKRFVNKTTYYQFIGNEEAFFEAQKILRKQNNEMN